MYRTLSIFFITFLTLASAACDFKKWGENCENNCFNCEDGCYDNNGICKNDKCSPGWVSENDGAPTCKIPECFGLRGCANNGKCVAPNTCLCGAQSGSNMVVEQFGEYSNQNGDLVKGTDCVNLRGFDRGLKGAFIAFVVLIVSISICGGIETFYMRRKMEAKRKNKSQ